MHHIRVWCLQEASFRCVRDWAGQSVPNPGGAHSRDLRSCVPGSPFSIPQTCLSRTPTPSDGAAPWLSGPSAESILYWRPRGQHTTRWDFTIHIGPGNESRLLRTENSRAKAVSNIADRGRVSDCSQRRVSMGMQPRAVGRPCARLRNPA